MKYRVKYRNLHCAERNPYRPDQRIKRGPWIKAAEYDNWADALVRCKQMARGMREVAIFIGQLIVKQDAYGRMPEADPTAALAQPQEAQP